MTNRKTSLTIESLNRRSLPSATTTTLLYQDLESVGDVRLTTPDEVLVNQMKAEAVEMARQHDADVREALSPMPIGVQQESFYEASIRAIDEALKAAMDAQTQIFHP